MSSFLTVYYARSRLEPYKNWALPLWTLPRPAPKIRYHGAMKKKATRSPARLALPGLLLLLAGYLLLAGLYAAQVPPWQAPDEPAHYNYIRQLAAGHLPIMQAQDYNEAYRAEIVSAGFAPPYSIEPLTYEDWQPPLYYLLQTPLFMLFDGALLPLRLFSIVLGAGVVLAAYATARQIWPDQAWLALTATAFIAFLPQHVAMLATVNNDSLAELLIAVLLWLLLLATARHPAARPAVAEAETGARSRLWLLSGIVLGMGFLTKATVYIMAPVVGLALLTTFWRRWHALLQACLLTFLPATLLGSLWWGRNLLVYGWPDLLGKQAHDAAVVGQKQTVTWIAEVGTGPALRTFLQTTFQSFWGQFGWMGVVMDRRVYIALLFFTLLVLAGLLWSLFRAIGKRQQHWPPARPHFLLLFTTFLLSLILYLGYNLTYVQHQGRYLFPALVPISLAVALGLATFARPLLVRRSALAWLLPTGLALALAGLDLLALFKFIVPALT